MNYEDLYEVAENRIRNELRSGEQFEVKDLFEGIIWNELQKGEKI